MNKITKNGYVLIAIFLIAVFLRLLGTHPGFQLTHADEQSTLGHIYNIIINHTLEPIDFYYGPLLPYIYSLVNIIFFVPLLFISFTLHNLQDYLMIGERPLLEFFGYFVDTQLKVSWPYFDFEHNYFTYWGRYSTAILSSVTVVVIYFLGKKLFGNKSVGLIAAFLTAVNYRHVFSSTLVLADAPAALFASLSLLLSVSILKKKTLRSYLLAGFGLALAYSVKYFIYVFPAFLICHTLYVWQSSSVSYFKKAQKLILNKKLFLALLASTILFFLINPYLITKAEFALKQFRISAMGYQVYSSSLDLDVKNYSLYPIYYLWKYGLGITLSVVTISGLFYGIIRYTKGSIILLSAIIPFFYMFAVASSRASIVHNFASIIPILMLFPALIIYKMGHLLPTTKKISTLIIISLSLLVGFSSLKNSLISSFYSSKLPNSYILDQWKEKNIPKTDKTIDIDPAREKYITIQDLQEEEAEFAIVDSNWNNVVNDKWTKNNDILKRAFFNDSSFWEALNNTYLSLLTKELGDYRIKEITKPFWQPLDFAFFIIKVPKFWKIHEDQLIATYNFNTNNELKKWTIASLFSSKSNVNISLNQAGNAYSGINIRTKECALQTRISSGKISVTEKKWYILSGLTKRKKIPTINTRDGFLRLDFYSSSNTKIKTYVSKQVDNTNWEKIYSSGIAPSGSKYARITFQIDSCFIDEEYSISELKLFSTDIDIKIDPHEYPYYGKDLPKNFIWAPLKYL